MGGLRLTHFVFMEMVYFFKSLRFISIKYLVISLEFRTFALQETDKLIRLWILEKK
jgi:hypothetical protein